MNRIKEIRKARKLSLEQVAALCDPPTTPTQVNRLEKGERQLTEAWMRRLAKALGCEIFDLLPDSRSERELRLLNRYRELSDKEQHAFEVMLGIKNDD